MAPNTIGRLKFTLAAQLFAALLWIFSAVRDLIDPNFLSISRQPSQGYLNVLSFAAGVLFLVSSAATYRSLRARSAEQRGILDREYGD